VSRSATDKRLATAVSVRADDTVVEVRLSDGRQLELRVADFGFLRKATPRQRRNCVVDSAGTALWWPSLLEGISVAGLIGVSETELEDFAGLWRRPSSSREAR
jgi:hypothetical protein